MKYSLQQLSEASGVSERSIRYYIQKGLLPRPQGERRGAFYQARHLADLLRIRQWQESGLSLDAIAELLQAPPSVPVHLPRPGFIEVRSHLALAEGIELVISPDRAGLTQQQLRRLCHAIREAYEDIASQNTGRETLESDSGDEQ